VLFSLLESMKAAPREDVEEVEDEENNGFDVLTVVVMLLEVLMALSLLLLLLDSTDDSVDAEPSSEDAFSEVTTMTVAFNGFLMEMTGMSSSDPEDEVSLLGDDVDEEVVIVFSEVELVEEADLAVGISFTTKGLDVSTEVEESAAVSNSTSFPNPKNAVESDRPVFLWDFL